MRTAELDYELPQELIAQHPLVPRDSSRLLVYDRKRDGIAHRDLPDMLSCLHPADIIVYNDSRVLRARVKAVKPTGGAVELLFLRRHRERTWEVLARPSARLREGMELGLRQPGADNIQPSPEPDGGGHIFTLKEHLGGGRWLLENHSGVTTEELLEQVGEMPLPPYIHEKLDEAERYQTVYAAVAGSAAAPTAGLHFTSELIERIRVAGVALAPLTLHVGLDTFRPVGEDQLELHEIHREHYHMPPETYGAIQQARQRGGRVLAVGTTTVRVLETVFAEPGEEGIAEPSAVLQGETALFITPGHRFRAVDMLLTNFHLPRSTLLALVMAFAGVDETRRLYREAVRERYRFYSFGDAMLLL